MNRVLGWLAALVERPAVKGLQAASTLAGWAFGGGVLLVASLLWTGLLRIEPTLARPTDGTEADRRAAEAAMLRAQFALEHEARARCTQAPGSAEAEWAEAYLDVRDALDRSVRLQGIVDDVLRLAPGSAHTLGWRIAVGWRFAEHVEAGLPARTGAAHAGLQHYACTALLDRSGLDVGIDSVVLTHIVLRGDPPAPAEADDPDDPCAPRQALRGWVSAVSHEPATLDLVLPRGVRITGPAVPMLPSSPAPAGATRQLVAQASAAIAGSSPACVPTPTDAPPTAPLPDAQLAGLGRTLQGHGTLLREIHGAVVGDAACATAVQATTARRQKALAFGLGAAPDCSPGAVSADGWVRLRPGSTTGDLGGLSLRMRCVDVCGACPTPGLPAESLVLRVEAAPFESCADSTASALPDLFGQLGARLAARAEAGVPFERLGVVGWASHLAPCAGQTNLGIAAARAEAMAAAIRSGAGTDATRVQVSATVQDAATCPVAHGATAAAAQRAHEPWRRVDLELAGAAVAFSPAACVAPPG